MTRAQYKVLDRLRKKQVNKSDVAVVESSSTSCTIYLPFPGLYLSYNSDGQLFLTQTIAEREKAGTALAQPGGDKLLAGEMADGVYKVPVYDDESEPF